MTSADAQGDGEYLIDPTSSGDPFTVFCDMTTDGGKHSQYWNTVLKQAYRHLPVFGWDGEDIGECSLKTNSRHAQRFKVWLIRYVILL